MKQISERVRRIAKLSWWEMKTFTQCPLAWQYQYLMKVKKRIPQYMTFGKAVHQAMEVFLKDFYGAMALAYDVAVDNACSNFDNIYAFEGPNLKRWLPIGNRVVRGLCGWTQEHEIEIHEVEPWLTKDVTRGSEFLYQFRGKADALATVDGVLTVLDWKTATRGYEKEKSLEDDRQLGCYRLLAGLEYVQQAFVIGMKPDGEAHWVPTQQTDADLKDLRKWIARNHRQMEYTKDLVGVYDNEVCRWCLVTPDHCGGPESVGR